jgi:hypothetical protein
MAEKGYTTRQIAPTVCISEKRVRQLAKREGIDITADKAVGRTRRHRADRIVSHIVLAAQDLSQGADLIDFRVLEPPQLAEWIASLKKSRAWLSAFIRKLAQHQPGDGESR